jgi:Carboxypeptidase regulatory-like domain
MLAWFNISMQRFIGSCVICLGLTFPALAQFDGRISGSIADPTGAPVPGASIELFLKSGKKPLLTTKTSSDGLFRFIGVRAGDYDLTVESTGFVKVDLRGLTVDAARETTVPPIKLQLATTTQTVEVNARPEGVQTTNAEISQTVSMEEIRNLPILDRDVLSVIQTQPGVVYNGNSYTVINGLRTSYSDVTLDGINVQDNYIRDNALDYLPNKLLMGQVRQMTIVSSNGNAATSGGATETAMSTPSGTNQFHGELFWYNRNNALSANDWFNNQAGVPLPFLNQNQGGASIGGPIKKDKLFFYSNYEFVRAHQQMPAETTILTSSARQGIFTYRDSSGALHSANLLTLRNLKGVDPVMAGILAQVPGAQSINNDLVGDGLNTGGYRFNQLANETRDNITGRLDYDVTETNQLSVSFAWNRDNSLRPDYENDYAVIPKSTNPTSANFLSASWRATPSAHWTNELRAGYNLTDADFDNSQKFGQYLIEGMIFNDPVNESFPQGRTTNTYVITDDAGVQKGSHYLQFGFYGKQIRVRSYDYAGTTPVYTLAMGAGQPALTTHDLPGIQVDDLANANALLATLGGYVDSYSETFNVTSRNSGYVPGAPFVRHFQMTDFAVYVQDKWKVSSRLTLTLGLRYNLPGVVSERDGLEVEPVLTGTATQTLLSNATVNYLGSSNNAPWYHRDKKDFGPNIGIAWDVFGDGKMAVRGGYSIFYVNDQSILAPENMLEANAGLQGYSSTTGLSDRTGTGLTPVPVTQFQLPLNETANYADNPFNILGFVDPNLRSPYVQQYSIGIQRDVKGTVLEARYVGNHVVGAYREFDLNQINVNSSGFLQDFIRAQNNGNLAQAKTGTFNPAYNASIPGSQPLTVFPQISGSGLLSNADVRNFIQTGQVADLAYFYQTNGLNGNVNFFPNPLAIAADYLTNYSNSTYNSLQLEARHRMKSGLSLEANYTFSKVLSDADGDSQTRFQNFLDANNPKLDRARANFDLNHMIKADGFYDLPFGKGKRFNAGRFNRLIGGWTVGSVMVWQSGAPFSILSGYGTLNRSSSGRSYYNGANTTLQGSALFNAVSFHMTGNGPYIVPTSAINPADGTGVNQGGPAFPGELFSNPGPGQLGTLQRRMFSGPWTFNIDGSIKKQIEITERVNAEIRMDAYNALNHATFWVGDQNINTNTFGEVSSMFFNPRVLQFGAYLKF